MYFFGTILIVAGIALALLASSSYVLAAKGWHAALGYGRIGVVGSFVAVLAQAALLVALFLARRFDIEYVYNYSARDLDIFFTVAAIWAGQPGSFLVWVLWMAVATLLLLRHSRHFEPYVLAVLMLIQAALLTFILLLNPFAPLRDVNSGLPMTPADGRGLNPLLHNFWMIIHPPVLFVGYALCSVFFAFAVGGLLRRDYDTWVTRALPWTLAAWSFLGLALLLGGYWAYETLGWGGYWGWDPVENSSLVPWLLTTALIHGMIVQRSHGALRRTNLVLALLAYVLVFYATFLTRSGVYANFSVHSFVAEGIYEVLLGFLLLLLLGSTAVLALRWRDVPVRPLSDKFLSRDSFFVLALLALVLLATLVGVGTSMPVISAIPGVGHSLQQFLGAAFDIDDGTTFGGRPFTDGRFSLMPSFFQQVTPPLGVVIVALLIIGPLLGWRDTNLRHLLHALRGPLVAAVIAVCVAMLLNVRDGMALVYVALSVFAAGTNIVMIIRTLRSGWMRIGGYLAHTGLCVLLIGVVGSSMYASPEERVVLATGDTLRIYGFDLTFNGWQQTPDRRGVLDLTVRDGDQTFQARPQFYFYQRMNATMQTPAVWSRLWQDLYIAPADYTPPVNPNQPELLIGDQVTVGPYTITFQGFDIDRAAMARQGAAEVGATLKIGYQGTESVVTPRLRLVAEQTSADETFQPLPVALPGGHTITLVTFSPEQRRVLLKIEGLNLPVQPAKAVVTVSTKPLVLLVWVGVAMGVLGGIVALLRRYVEGVAHLSGARVRLPKSLAGLAGHFGWRGAAR